MSSMAPNTSIAQVETLLKHQDVPHTTEATEQTNTVEPDLYSSNSAFLMESFHNNADSSYRHQSDIGLGAPVDSTMGNADPSLENISLGWDMMSLGVEEALPTPEVQDALYVT